MSSALPASATVAVMLSLFGVVSRASADCSPPNHFENAGRAALVYVGRVQSLSQTYGARVAVQTVLKGRPGAQREVAFNPFTDGMPVVGQRYLLFQDGSGSNLGGCPTVSLAPASLGELGVSESTLLSALRRFIAATAQASRRAALVDLATTGATELASHAAAQLAREPVLVRAITADERRRVVAALGRAPGRPSSALALVAARLHALEAVPALIGLLDTRGQLNSRVIEDTLELLSNHHEPLYQHGQDLPAASTAGLQRRWRAWEARHRGRAIDDVIAEGYRERGVAPPAAGDAHALAALVRTGPDHLTRAVAAESLERATGGHSTFPDYLHGAPSQADWDELARLNLGSLPAP